MKKIKVDKIYHSIQGEGATQGTSSIFVNLVDSNEKSITVDKFLNRLDEDKFLHKLKLGSHLIFTGDEPLLQEAAIMEFIKQIKFLYGFKPFIEIETDATKSPCKTLINNVEIFNCTPKLSNSKVPLNKRMKTNIIKKYISTGNKAIFKFEIANEKDLEEIKTEWIEVMNIPKRLIYLMSASENFIQFTIKNALENNLNYSNKLRYE